MNTFSDKATTVEVNGHKLTVEDVTFDPRAIYPIVTLGNNMGQELVVEVSVTALQAYERGNSGFMEKEIKEQLDEIIK